MLQLASNGTCRLPASSGYKVQGRLSKLCSLGKVFGCDVNSKGFKKPRGCGVIQGDGINITTLAQIVDAVTDAGYSAEVCLSMYEDAVPSWQHRVQ